MFTVLGKHIADMIVDVKETITGHI